MFDGQYERLQVSEAGHGPISQLVRDACLGLMVGSFLLGAASFTLFHFLYLPELREPQEAAEIRQAKAKSDLCGFAFCRAKATVTWSKGSSAGVLCDTHRSSLYDDTRRVGKGTLFLVTVPFLVMGIVTVFRSVAAILSDIWHTCVA